MVKPLKERILDVQGALISGEELKEIRLYDIDKVARDTGLEVSVWRVRPGHYRILAL